MSNVKWTLEAVKLEASKYETRGAFARGSQAAYASATRNGWLEEIGLPKLKWTFEKVKFAASNYTSAKDFLKGNPAAHTAAYRYGWLGELFPK